MTAYETLRYEEPAGHVARITLARPAQLNAYTSEMCVELVDALERFVRDDTRRALVLTGEGRGFCAGGDIAVDDDIQKAHERQLGHAIVMREAMHAVALALWDCDKPTIAAINGPAVAGGLALALGCDLRIASDRARMGDTSGNFGLLPDEGGAWLFPRAMGPDAALRMMLLGEVYDAPRALELGLVGEVVPHDRLQERALELAERLAARSPLAQRVTKRLVRSAERSDLPQALRDAQLAVLAVNDSADAQEGVAAFREKRTPAFHGH